MLGAVSQCRATTNAIKLLHRAMGHGHGRTTEPNSTRTRRELSGLCRHPKIACRLKLCLRVVQLFLLSSRRLLIRRLCWLYSLHSAGPPFYNVHTRSEERGTEQSSCVLALRAWSIHTGGAVCVGWNQLLSPHTHSNSSKVALRTWSKKKSPVYNTQHFNFKRSDFGRNQYVVQHLKLEEKTSRHRIVLVTYQES